MRHTICIAAMSLTLIVVAMLNVPVARGQSPLPFDVARARIAADGTTAIDRRGDSRSLDLLEAKRGTISTPFGYAYIYQRDGTATLFLSRYPLFEAELRADQDAEITNHAGGR